MRSKQYASGLFGVHSIAYATFLYVTYYVYEGGREFVASDILTWVSSVMLPVVISLIPWSIMLLLKRDKAAPGFYWSVAVFSAVGAAISSLAAYLAWWSTTQ